MASGSIAKTVAKATASGPLARLSQVETLPMTVNIVGHLRGDRLHGKAASSVVRVDRLGHSLLNLGSTLRDGSLNCRRL